MSHRNTKSQNQSKISFSPSVTGIRPKVIHKGKKSVRDKNISREEQFQQSYKSMKMIEKVLKIKQLSKIFIKNWSVNDRIKFIDKMMEINYFFRIRYCQNSLFRAITIIDQFMAKDVKLQNLFQQFAQAHKNILF